MTKSDFFQTVWRYLKFAASTLAGTGVDLGVVWLCAHLLFDSPYFIYNDYKWGEYVLSPFISFECAVLTNYVFAYFFVWRDRIAKRSHRDFWRRYIPYNFTSTATFLLKMVFLLLIERIAHSMQHPLDVTWCNLIAICITGLLNFFIQELFVFGSKQKPNSALIEQEQSPCNNKAD